MKKSSLFLLAVLCALQSAWSEPLREIECTIVPVERSQIHHNSGSSVYQSTFSSSLASSSTNWCGYTAAKDFLGASCSNGSVTQVSGSWTVPTLTPTASDNAYCAVWVGIDGYQSSTVEQIGTAHYWAQGTQQNYAWFEMFPANSNVIQGFPINEGDVLSASVEYIGNNTFQMQISNHTQGVTTTVPTSNTVSASALRNSAEWIVEAPYSNGILPLSDFNSVAWTNCSTQIQGTTGSIDGGFWTTDNMTMASSSGSTEATASSLSSDGSGFQVTWVSE